MQDAKVRKHLISKGYSCLLITSAIHMELATDLTPSWLPCGASYHYVASVGRSKVTTEQTLLELGDPPTKYKNCFHHSNIRTSSHPPWRIMEFSEYDIYSSESSSLGRETGVGCPLCQTWKPTSICRVFHY